MNNKIKEILIRSKEQQAIDVFKEFIETKGNLVTDYSLETYMQIILDYITNLQKENDDLKNKLNQYENPDDLTLFYMWLDTKAKDKIKQLQEENEFLKLNNPEMNIRHFDMIKENKRKIGNLRAENKRLKKTIVIMEKYLELIHDLGYDYDGLNYEHDLKGLIDDMVRFASLGRACNTTQEIYVDGKGKSLNILGEELKDNK